MASISKRASKTPLDIGARQSRPLQLIGVSAENVVHRETGNNRRRGQNDAKAEVRLRCSGRDNVQFSALSRFHRSTYDGVRSEMKFFEKLNVVENFKDR
jgi:hypothetical protein